LFSNKQPKIKLPQAIYTSGVGMPPQTVLKNLIGIELDLIANFENLIGSKM
jgi:hypothetical protein